MNALIDFLKEATGNGEFQPSYLSDINKLFISNELTDEQKRLKTKIELIGVAFYPLLKRYDCYVIAQLSKLAISHLPDSESYASAVADKQHETILVEVLQGIGDAFLAMDVLTAKNLKQAKVNTLHYLLE